MTTTSHDSSRSCTDEATNLLGDVFAAILYAAADGGGIDTDRFTS
ncbi:hypothetical protein [Nonomuraea sp. NPDC049784]